MRGDVPWTMVAHSVLLRARRSLELTVCAPPLPAESLLNEHGKSDRQSKLPMPVNGVRAREPHRKGENPSFTLASVLFLIAS